MKIVVTGGAGFIGSHLVDLYIKNGHSVAVIDNLSTGKRQNLHPKAELIEMDIRDPKIISLIHDIKPDVINHHAAQISVNASIEDPVKDADINVLGTLGLLEAARKNGIRKFIFASSAAVYGSQKEFPAGETHSTIPINPYGLSKLTAENYINFYAREHGISATTLRYSNVYGPRQRGEGEGGVVAIFSEAVRDKKAPTIYGDGNQTRDFIFVGDVAMVNLQIAQRNITGTFNVSTGKEESVNTLYHMISNALLFQEKPRYVRALDGDPKRSLLDNQKLLSDLSVSLTPLTEGINKTAEWFQSKKTS